MSDRRELIAQVWAWDRYAMEAKKPPEFRRGIWRILDALYDDLAMARTPGFRDSVRKALDSLKQSEQVLAVRKELGL